MSNELQYVPHSLSLYTALEIDSPILLTRYTVICNDSYLLTRTQIRDNVPHFLTCENGKVFPSHALKA